MEQDREIIKGILEKVSKEFQFEIFEFSKSRKTKHFIMPEFWVRFREEYKYSETSQYFSWAQVFEFLIPYQRVETDFQILIFGKVAPKEYYRPYYEWQDWKQKNVKYQKYFMWHCKIKILNK